MKAIADLVNYLDGIGEELIPMSENEIKKIENDCKCLLPKYYKEFLLRMGKGAGRFMMGSSVFFDELNDLNEGGHELLLENNFKKMPKNAYVFWMHQGYQLAFFILNEGDNPPIYFFAEGSGQSDFIKEESLVSFFEKQLKMSDLL